MSGEKPQRGGGGGGGGGWRRMEERRDCHVNGCWSSRGFEPAISWHVCTSGFFVMKPEGFQMNV